MARSSKLSKEKSRRTSINEDDTIDFIDSPDMELYTKLPKSLNVSGRYPPPNCGNTFVLAEGEDLAKDKDVKGKGKGKEIAGRPTTYYESYGRFALADDEKEKRIRPARWDRCMSMPSSDFKSYLPPGEFTSQPPKYINGKQSWPLDPTWKGKEKAVDTKPVVERPRYGWESNRSISDILPDSRSQSTPSLAIHPRPGMYLASPLSGERSHSNPNITLRQQRPLTMAGQRSYASPSDPPTPPGYWKSLARNSNTINKSPPTKYQQSTLGSQTPVLTSNTISPSLAGSRKSSTSCLQRRPTPHPEKSHPSISLTSSLSFLSPSSLSTPLSKDTRRFSSLSLPLTHIPENPTPSPEPIFPFLTPHHSSQDLHQRPSILQRRRRRRNQSQSHNSEASETGTGILLTTVQEDSLKQYFHSFDSTRNRKTRSLCLENHIDKIFSPALDLLGVPASPLDRLARTPDAGVQSQLQTESPRVGSVSAKRKVVVTRQVRSPGGGRMEIDMEDGSRWKQGRSQRVEVERVAGAWRSVAASIRRGLRKLAGRNARSAGDDDG